MNKIKPKLDDVAILEDAVISSRRFERQLNAITRAVVKRTYDDMYHEPMKVRPFHRYYKLWVGRTAFYNFLEDRGGLAPDRCLGVLIADYELRLAVGLPPYHLKEDECQIISQMKRTNGARQNLLDKLSTTESLGTISRPLPAC